MVTPEQMELSRLRAENVFVITAIPSPPIVAISLFDYFLTGYVLALCSLFRRLSIGRQLSA